MSAQVEEMSASAEHLRATASQLQALAERFKLGQAEQGAPILRLAA